MKLLRIFLSNFALLTGAAVLTLLIANAGGAENFLGSFLIASYSFMGYIVPGFFFWIFWLIAKRNIRLLNLFWPLMGLVPFFFLSLAARALMWNQSAALPPLWRVSELFGQNGAVTFWTVLGMGTILLLTSIYYTVAAKNKNRIKNYTQSVLQHSMMQQRTPLAQGAVSGSWHLSKNRSIEERQSRTLAEHAKQDQEEDQSANAPLTSRNTEPLRYASYPTGLVKDNAPEPVIFPEKKEERYMLLFHKHNNARDYKYYSEYERERMEDDNPIGVEAYASYMNENWEEEEGEEGKKNEEDIDIYELDSMDRLKKFQGEALDLKSSSGTKKKEDEGLVDTKEQEYSNLSLQQSTEKIDAAGNEPQDIKKKKKTSSTLEKRKNSYIIPISGILNPPALSSGANDDEQESISKCLELTLKEFNIDAKVVSVCRGPVVTLFEILPAPGVRLRRIVELSDNIALRLAASSIRIVAPIPGKEAVGIEVPNYERDTVRFSELISQTEFRNKKNKLPIALGKNILAKTIVVDLTRTPHMLIAGATGSGKSVCINSILCSLLYSCDPDTVKFILIDPKIVELSFYNAVPHLLTPVISDPGKSVKVLSWCVEEMERRYAILEQHNVREIQSYNKKLEQNDNAEKMKYIVIVIDEFADLMMMSGKEMEGLVSRIAAKSRAVGIHLIIATQRPSTDVITGLIKSNVPTRISFMVASKIDSRIILDVNGAEKLLGKGDMLYSSAQHPFPDRLQGAFLEEDEVERIVQYVKKIGGAPNYMDESVFENKNEETEYGGDIDDVLWDQAVDEVIQSQRASASHLQRRFKIGYNRAARLVETMEYRGIIGPQQGSKQREVLIA